MNITRENLSDLELRIKVEINENDYAENVTKQLKRYQHQATVPGFRKGMAPMAMIQRLYKPSIMADEVNNIIGQNLYKYLDDEKLNILGSPLANDELTGTIDFAGQKDFAFYFDAALTPEVNIDWTKISATLTQIKVPTKDVDAQVEEIQKRYGKFETPETVADGDHVYGKAVELDKSGNPKDGGVSVFLSFETKEVKDEEIRAQIIGLKKDDKVVFNAFKAFGSAFIEKNFHMENAAAKKFKSNVEFSVSGCSRITPHELDEELFNQVFPDQKITAADKFRKAVAKELEKVNDEQSRILFVNQVRKQLLDNFDAPIPEAFLKRWILSQDKKELTAEELDAKWQETYIPGIKWELIDGALNKIKDINPTRNEIVDYIKDILRKNDNRLEDGESAEDKEKRLEEAASSIASDHNNTRQIVDRIALDKTFDLFKEQLKPEVEKISLKEFNERVKADKEQE
jgi:trigger factor